MNHGLRFTTVTLRDAEYQDIEVTNWQFVSKVQNTEQLHFWRQTANTLSSNCIRAPDWKCHLPCVSTSCWNELPDRLSCNKCIYIYTGALYLKVKSWSQLIATLYSVCNRKSTTNHVLPDCVMKAQLRAGKGRRQSLITLVRSCSFSGTSCFNWGVLSLGVCPDLIRTMVNGVLHLSGSTIIPKLWRTRKPFVGASGLRQRLGMQKGIRHRQVPSFYWDVWPLAHNKCLTKRPLCFTRSFLCTLSSFVRILNDFLSSSAATLTTKAIQPKRFGFWNASTACSTFDLNKNFYLPGEHRWKKIGISMFSDSTLTWACIPQIVRYQNTVLTFHFSETFTLCGHAAIKLLLKKNPARISENIRPHRLQTFSASCQKKQKGSIDLQKKDSTILEKETEPEITWAAS